MRNVFLFVALAVLISRVPAEDPPAAPNLMPNASFEDAGREGPRGWRRERWNGRGTLGYAETGRTGSRSVQISSTEGADWGWAATAPIEPFARYRLSGWIKTENVRAAGGGRGALLNLHGLQGIATRALTGDNDWTRVDVEFDAEDASSVQVNCLFGGWGMATGTAWFDDVQLEQISKSVPPEPRIRIDAARVGQPMTSLVYSQFIEHLGRCIYGGIWAEMLEDRKFYFPIGPEYRPYRSLTDQPFPVVGASPWQIIGPVESVAMDADRPFAARHAPQICAGAGIRQR